MTGPVGASSGSSRDGVAPVPDGLPTRFEVGDGPVVFNALQIDVDRRRGVRRQSTHPAALVEV